jgi:hypothetical protein
MFNRPYPNLVNVRSEGDQKCSVLIRGTEFPLFALYNADILINPYRANVEIIVSS